MNQIAIIGCGSWPVGQYTLKVRPHSPEDLGAHVDLLDQSGSIVATWQWTGEGRDRTAPKPAPQAAATPEAGETRASAPAHPDTDEDDDAVPPWRRRLGL